jgi:hypothetical protein
LVEKNDFQKFERASSPARSALVTEDIIIIIIIT